MTNFMDSLTMGLSAIVGAAGLEVIQTVIVCVGFVKVIEVVYKIIKEGYTDKKGASVVGYSTVIGIGRVLPELFAYITSLLGA